MSTGVVDITRGGPGGYRAGLTRRLYLTWDPKYKAKTGTTIEPMGKVSSTTKSSAFLDSTGAADLSALVRKQTGG